MRRISSWGRLSTQFHDVVKPNDPSTTVKLIARGRSPGLARGMGRSYGDVCLNPQGILWDMTGLDHFIEFNPETGLLRCEAGVLVRDVQRLAFGHGWTLPVTPGTQLVTIGGAIANDVHGKNHHNSGSFGNHLQQIKLIRTNGESLECGPQLRPDWFAATIGGLGLTGVIVEAEIQLRSAISQWLETETIPYATLEEFFHLADDSDADWEHTVSWIDCISQKNGRGLFMRGNPAYLAEPREYKRHEFAMPFVPPVSLVNRLSLRPFNSAYFYLKKLKKRRTIEHHERFLYPLDHLRDWNRIYGPKGFFQYQSVIPRGVGLDATKAMLREISRSGEGSFLAVLKTFGNRQPIGLMSFPRPGVTLALDFPNNGERTFNLFNRMDTIVRESGGCIYLAKDARMPRDLFESGYPHLNRFLKYRDPGISSALSRRLMGG